MQAEAIYKQILAAFPKNIRAIKGLENLHKTKKLQISARQALQYQFNQMISLYNNGQLETVAVQAQKLLENFPNYNPVWNILGVALQKQGKFEEAIAAYERALAIKPDYVEAHSNLGYALQEQGDLDQAIAAYERALAIKPDYVEAHNNLGYALQKQGKLDQAIAAYERALAIKPDYADVHNNLANVLQRQGRLDQAIAAYERTLAIKPDYADAYHNMSVALQGQGRLEEAIAACKQALAIKPGLAEAHNDMGIPLQWQGKLEEAIAAYERAIAIKPDYADAHSNLGNALKNQGKLDQAIIACERAIAIKPDHINAHNNMALALVEQGKLEEAIAAYERVIAIKPDHINAHNNIGIALVEQGKLEEAIMACERAITIKPDFADAYNSMAVALAEQGKLKEAIMACERAITIKPDFADAHSNMGNALKDQGKLEEAIAAYERAIAIKPDHAEAYNNTGVVLQQQGKVDEAIAVYEQAIAIKPGYVGAIFNKSLALLLTGEFIQGWKLHEYRWKRKSFETQRHASLPMWSGKEPLQGKTILLHSEQGLGDTIQFSRYTESLFNLGCRVILEVQPPLVLLLSNLAGISQVVAQGMPLPNIDFQIPLMSLPLACKTVEETIPCVVPYISIDTSKIISWSERLGPRTKPRIGIVWSGNAAHKNDHNRSTVLQQWLPMLSNEYQWISLQKEVRECDREALSIATQIVHFGDEIKDFTDTAALCHLCDVVLSVDTSVAHLAGALGRPVWVLLPFAPDWRWLLDRDDSPWYPTAKLYRQQNIGDWTNVIERISVDLAQAFNLPYLAQSLADDMVIMGDMKVPSLILEDTLRTGAGIKDAAVVGVEAIGGDDIVCVALVLADDANVEAIRVGIQQLWAVYKVRIIIAVVDDLARTESGKVNRANVRDFFRQQLEIATTKS